MIASIAIKALALHFGMGVAAGACVGLFMGLVKAAKSDKIQDVVAFTLLGAALGYAAGQLPVFPVIIL